MYHIVIPVTSKHDPIVVEGQVETQVIIFNAGPAAIEAQLWQNWKGKINNKYSENSNEPNLKLEFRAGSEKIVSGSFIRVGIKNADYLGGAKEEFAALGIRVLSPIDETINP